MALRDFLKSVRIILKKDPLRYFKNNFHDVEQLTLSKEQGNAFEWMSEADILIDILGSIFKSVPNEEACNSMLVLRLMELQKTLVWLEFCALYGSYFPLIRELRFILESFLQAYYFDKNFPNKSIEDKFHTLDEDELEYYGRKLREKVDLKNIDDIKKIYSHLSKYEHSSPLELKRTIMDGNVNERLFFEYDKKMFGLCKELTNSVMDNCFFIVFSYYDMAIQNFPKDNITIDWLKKLNLKNLLSILNLD